jgi:hypothetical protein
MSAAEHELALDDVTREYQRQVLTFTSRPKRTKCPS